MNANETNQIRPKLPDGTSAFTAILKDMGIVFHMDYRHPTFKKWHEVVGTALDLFLGPLHPKTLEFQALRFKHAESRDTPEGTPVPHEDEMTYSAGLDATKTILEYALNECRECDEAEARRMKKLKENPPVPVAPPPMEIRIIKNKAPGGSMHFDFGGSKAPVAEEEPDGTDASIVDMKIVSRTGATGPVNIESFIKGLDDPQEREMVIRLKEVLDNPGSSWTDVKTVLEEIINFRRETALRLLPIIVKG